jgi:serine/threonine-protein kinase
VSSSRLQAALAARYTIGSEIGRGGMARVYRAHDRQHDRDVAIKVLHPELAAAVGAERFLREIRIAARLQHPHILPLHDSGTADGLLYFVMPYVEGEALRDRLRREKQLPLADALRIAREVADALAYAHAHNVVHRDIKPGNILLSGGHAIVADFGIARAISAAGGQEVTTTGTVIGTPEYMSPEQASGEPAIDGRSDVYSLACVLYEMLGGEPPFTGRTPQVVLARHRQESPLALSVIRPHLPQEVERALRIALAKIPADRFATAKEFADQLDPARWREPPGAASSGLTRRRQGVLVLLLLSIASALVLVARQRRPVGAASSSVGVAVLPFDGPPAAAGESFPPAAGAVGLFSEALNWVPGVHAIDGSSLAAPSRPWRAAPLADVLGAAKRAGAKYLVGGTVVPDSQGSRVNLELFAVADGERVFRAADTASGQRLDGPIRRLALRSAEAVASREGLDLGSRKAVFAASSSTAAVGQLIQGQLRFWRRDFDGAAAAFRQAIAADSACGLAYHRLSVAEWWSHDFPASFAAVEAGLRRREQIPRRWLDLMEAQRNFLTGQGDRAIAGFQDVVLNQPAEVDGWFGLGEALYHFGGFAGYSPQDARPAFDRMVALDSTFAPVFDHLVDLALYAGDRDAASAHLSRLPADDPLRAVREVMVALRFEPPQGRDTALARLRPMHREALSDVVIYAAHGGFDLDLAVTVAGYLLGADRTPDDRRRGAQYRLAALTGMGRWPAALRSWAEVAGRFPFDPWIVEASFAGFPADSVAEPMFAWARTQVAEGRSPDFGRPLWDDVQQSFQALVHRATREGDSAEVNDLLGRIDGSRPSADPADPTRTGLRASLRSRLALLAGDTVGAIGLLEESVSRIPELYTANYPLTAMGPQRLLLSEIQEARGAPAEAGRWRDSFRHTWSVADVFYLARLGLIPRGR